MRRKIRMQNPQQPDQALGPITGALAVDVFELALAPSLLRAICSIASIGIAEFASNVVPPIPTKYQQIGRLPRTFARIFNMPRKKQELN
jgi:hypothetical protein